MNAAVIWDPPGPPAEGRGRAFANATPAKTKNQSPRVNNASRTSARGEMSDPAPFVFDGREVRTVTINAAPWFNVADLCEILEIQNPRDVVAKSLRKDDVARIYTLAADGKREATAERRRS